MKSKYRKDSYMLKLLTKGLKLWKYSGQDNEINVPAGVAGQHNNPSHAGGHHWFPPSNPVNKKKIWKYYQQHVLAYVT